MDLDGVFNFLYGLGDLLGVGVVACEADVSNLTPSQTCMYYLMIPFDQNISACIPDRTEFTTRMHAFMKWFITLGM